MGDLASPGAALFSLSVVLTAVIRVANHVECTSEHNRNQSDPKNSSKKLEIRESRRETARSTLSNDFHVAIIGGGIGGLAAALALQQKGIKCTVYERDRVFADRKQGYGLTLSNTPNGGLAKLGILEECIRHDCNSNSHWVFTPEGKILGYYGRAFKSYKAKLSKRVVSSGHMKHRGNLRIPRQDLRQMLLNRLLPETVQWNHKCEGLEESEDGKSVIVRFDDGSTVQADIVVGADGLRSTVRAVRDRHMSYQSRAGKKNDAMKSDSIQYIGVSVILGISSFQHPLLANQGYYIIDGTHRLFTMPFREDEKGNTILTMWQLSFSGLSEGEANLLKMSGARAQLADAIRRTSEWFPSAHDLIRSTSEKDVWSTPLYDRDPMPSRSRQHCKGSLGGRITVLGDACHPMSMFKGQGANQALEDGPRLVEWLLKEGKKFSSLSVPMRLHHFEKEMRDRTSKWVLASRSASLMLHSENVLRDALDPDTCLYGLDGLDKAESVELLRRLQEEGISAATVTAAACREELEHKVLEEYQQLLSAQET